MLAILFVAASLLTQAYIFRDLEVSDSNSQVNIVATYAGLVPAPDPVDGSSGESDSSPSTKPASDR